MYKFARNNRHIYGLYRGHLHRRRVRDVKKLGAEITGHQIKFNFNGKDIIFYYQDKNQLEISLANIRMQFYLQEYKWLKVKDSTVIDIGASTADTALYFAARGAKRVISYEPDKTRYHLGKKNLQLNNLGRVVKMENRNSPPIDSIIAGIKEKNLVMKIDCEGCEYPLLRESKKLRRFKQITMEYHYGPEELVDILKKEGFDVSYTNPSYLYDPDSEDKNMYYGMIYASRK